jgi:hypothetical protein
MRSNSTSPPDIMFEKDVWMDCVEEILTEIGSGKARRGRSLNRNNPIMEFGVKGRVWMRLVFPVVLVLSLGFSCKFTFACFGEYSC